MPDEIEAAIGLAERDPEVKVIVLRGAGRAFSGGYDFGGGFQHWGEAMMTEGRWDPGKDFAMVIARETGPKNHGDLAGVQTGDRPGARLVCGWGQRLEARVAEIAAELARIPLSQLRAQKLIVNQAYENMGLASTQMLGGILDGLMRNTPEALDFIQTAATEGVRAAVERRDGPFGDYGQAPAELRPDPSHVIEP
jgi:enoyl-CoA hydratase/carnithine racemase